jgi:hypothetical protein
MSAYYDVELAFNLREGVPSQVVSAIAFLTGDLKDPPDRPNHPYFLHTWGAGALARYSTTPPCRGFPICNFANVYRHSQSGEEHYQYTFHLRCRDKLTPLFEGLFPFLQWAAPFCDGRQFVGYFIEEDACQPTLIYVNDGQVYMHEVREPPNSVIDGSTSPDVRGPREKALSRQGARKPWWKLW